ncbi:Crp/Fnr family transcriptional regulator [Paenibacillus pasadenensis]|uniref:Crp/Fnr family transcriptional regulator n=1 Tax=Paenibacillus pasadenensis TaxID=217090 RepID=UPI0020413595|nr:Crp/Fnr family transcriptional regulator [Paenibacillus pasadenensis]MCM3747809.1 Crp/Fnr family transcriptional regulator [Paenibacillus pasadenensis]
MRLHRGEVLFRQGEQGQLFELHSGMLKIVRSHPDGSQILVNLIVPGEIIPHHSLLSPHPYYGTAIALVPSELNPIAAPDWYRDLEDNAQKCRSIALLLQDKLRMMQQRMDQLTDLDPLNRIKKLEAWLSMHLGVHQMGELLTQEEIGQLIGLRRETVNRLLKKRELPLAPADL